MHDYEIKAARGIRRYILAALALEEEYRAALMWIDAALAGARIL